MTKTATVHAQQRWEYMSISRKTDTYLAGELNTLGQDGWELVTASFARGKKDEMFWTAFVKRPAVGHAAATTAQEAKPARHDPVSTSATPGKTKEHPTEPLQGFDLDEEDLFADHEKPDEQE